MAEGKFFSIRSDLNGMVLGVSYGSAEPGTTVIMWPSHGGQDQLWYEDFVHCCIRSALDDNLVLEVQGKHFFEKV